MFFNRIMLDVVQLTPDTLTQFERNTVLTTCCTNMRNSIIALENCKFQGNIEEAKKRMCHLVHYAVVYLHTIDALATDVSNFEYEDALYVPACAGLQGMPVAAWKQHIPQWGDSVVDTRLASLVFAVLAWCSVNNWGFNQMWLDYRRTLYQNADLLIKAMREHTECKCSCEPVVVNPDQLELPLK